ncbi:hypothetical protein FKP32DRAFT_1580372 [Trametes sanguinea]|nr:hypothetical protein FKP32DRAFT_1580372 [Trametes sanguinea]
MQYLTVLATLAAFATSALATPTGNLTSSVSPIALYSNNCKGSLECSLSIGRDCARAIASVDQSATYNDQAQFSIGNCYMIYATNGAGDQPVSGAVIIDTARSILDGCSNICGSFGTNNCASCHVTLNYRA